MEFQYPPHQRQGSYAEEGRSVNHLKAGIGAADRLLTVSPGYAKEVTTMLGGWGLDGLLAARQPVLNGIVNGIDNDECVRAGPMRGPGRGTRELHPVL